MNNILATIIIAILFYKGILYTTYRLYDEYEYIYDKDILLSDDIYIIYEYLYDKVELSLCHDIKHKHAYIFN